MRFPISLAVLALLIPFGAHAQEAISTASASDAGPPPASAPAAQANGEEDPGDWARRVLAGKPAPDEAKPGGPSCAMAATDDRPQGEVWAGIGTRGYREIGGVVTQKIGECSSVTIAVSKTEGPNLGRHSGRRR